MQEKGIGLSRLSQLSDVNIRHLQKIASDENYNPTLYTLSRIANALGVPIKELYEEVDNEQTDAEE